MPPEVRGGEYRSLVPNDEERLLLEQIRRLRDDDQRLVLDLIRLLAQLRSSQPKS